MPRLIENKPKELRLPYIEINRTKHGDRYYFRRERHGPRAGRLPDDFRSKAFMKAYEGFLAGRPVEGSAGVRTSFNTFGWLIKLYLASPEFKEAYKASSQVTRRRQLEKLGARHGATPLDEVGRLWLQTHILNAKRATPFEANVQLGVLNKMFKWAMQTTMPDPRTGAPVALVEENPCKLVDRLTPPKRARGEDDELEELGHPTMTEEHQALYEAAYPHGTRARKIYEVLFCTGLRVGDAARVGRQHVKRDAKGEFIKINTEKTGAECIIGMTERLKHALADSGQLLFLTTTRGKPYKKSYLTKEFTGYCRKIGLKHTPHSMRKTAVCRLIEQTEGKISNEQLMGIFGWVSSAMPDKYKRQFNREKVVRGAMVDFNFAHTAV